MVSSCEVFTANMNGFGCNATLQISMDGGLSWDQLLTQELGGGLRVVYLQEGGRRWPP